MKKHIYISLFAITGLFSCSLDPVLENTYGDEFAFGLPDKTEGFLMNAYGNIPGTFIADFSNNFLDAATDNAVTNDFSGGIYRIGSGGLTVQNNPVGNWNRAYTQFRNIHIFLEKGLGDNVIYNLHDKDADSLKRINLKGEAFYLRAWWGFQLLQNFGGKTDAGEALGYAIVLSSLTNEDARNLDNVVRNTYEECVDQIMTDLDSAYYYLPVTYSGNDPILGIQNLGRADRHTTLALRSRVSLYAASPAYQSDDITVINGIGQFTVVDAVKYEEKWAKAALYAQEAIDLIGNFVSLRPNHFNANTTPAEFIWRTYHNNRALENQNYPIKEFGNARTGPSQNLVNAFPMANGFPITDVRSGYDPQNPYQDRDPRLVQTVFYNGAELNNKPLEIYEGGKDSRTGHQENTRSGYYLRKWLSVQPGLLSVENPGNDHHYHVLLRRTELFLNLAEASNEAFGPTAIGPDLTFSAVDIMKQIRSATGIMDHTYLDEVAAQGKDAFRGLIQNERRIELAFENHRFYDMRRWLLPLNEPVKGMSISKDEAGVLTFEEKEIELRPLNDLRFYYQPVPYNEIVKSPNLVNNLGW